MLRSRAAASRSRRPRCRLRQNLRLPPSCETRAMRAPQDEGRSKQLRLRQPLIKLRDIDQRPCMLTLAELALALEGSNIKADHAALDGDHLGRGAHHGADQCCREMPD